MQERKDLLFAIENSQELIIQYDANGIILHANVKTKELTGYEEEEIQGIFIGELFRDVFYQNTGRIKEEYEQKELIETVVYRKNKTCFPVELKLAETTTEGEEVCFAMAVDMTAYKESIRKVEEKTEEVRESMRARDAFVANVTHELRTPVNGIKGHTELILEREEDMQKQNYLKMILDCCSTMEGIINNILDFSKLEAGKFQLDEKPFSFYEFMEKMEKMFNTLVVRKGLRFFMNIAPEIPDRLVGDELRLTQILNNLVSNAVKFTSQGYVGIEVIKNMQVQNEIELFFMVVDTGIGLSPEDKDKLFKSFSQADSSITRKYGGTGLGLSITKDLVNMMKGDIWAEGEKGKGSSFSFTIRMRLEERGEAEEVTREVPRWRPQEQINNMAGERELMYELGSEINEREIRSAFEKMNISMDMENWYKAEAAAAMVKQLLQQGSKELQRAIFKMEMAIRKADYDKAREAADIVKECLVEEWKTLK